MSSRSVLLSSNVSLSALAPDLIAVHADCLSLASF